MAVDRDGDTMGATGERRRRRAAAAHERPAESGRLCLLFFAFAEVAIQLLSLAVSHQPGVTLARFGAGGDEFQPSRYRRSQRAACLRPILKRLRSMPIPAS